MDMSASCHLFGTPEGTAREIKDRIRDELRITVNIGVSDVKMLAKMASDFRKPDLVYTIYLRNNPSEDVAPPGVGDVHRRPRHSQKAFFHGNQDHRRSCAVRPFLAESSPAEAGEVIWGFANGVDLSPVLAQPALNKGYGNSTTAPFDVTDTETTGRILLVLSETVGNRLQSDDVKIQVVSVGIRYFDLSYFSHQRVLDAPTDLTLEIYNAAKGLFLELWDGRRIRHLGVHRQG